MGRLKPFDIYFYYDWNETSPDLYLIGTTTTSKSLSHAFYPCTTTTFTQELDVYDQLGFAGTTSKATEAGGNPC